MQLQASLYDMDQLTATSEISQEQNLQLVSYLKYFKMLDIQK